MRPAFAAILLAAATQATALDVVPPPHQARKDVAGVVRVWGNPEVKAVLERWQEGFRQAHPQVRFENHLTGTDVGMAGLYTGSADMVFLGRDARESEVKAFEWVYRYRPERVKVMTGLDRPGRSPALVAYVHHGNPLAHLTLAELDAIFSHERLRGAPAAITTWGALGLKGDWAGKPINLYTFETETGTGRYFRHAALKGSRKLNWERMTEFRDTTAASKDAGRRILDALAADRYGLAVASGPAPSRVKTLALVTGTGAEPIEPTRENIASRRYPFARPVFAYYNHKPDSALDAPVAEFLRYVASDAGQREVGDRDGYVPLSKGLDAIPAYRPDQKVSGTIRIRGDNGQGAMLKTWQAGFAKYHPDVHFDTELLSTAHALPALYLKLADVGLIGREQLPIENLAFRRTYRYDPTEIAIATGSYDTPYRSYAFAIYVNKDNPLERITIPQLKSIYGCGPGKHIRTWGDLGLTGEWADKPIHVSGYATGTNLAIFFEWKVLGAKAAGGQGLPEGVRWNCDLKEYGTTYAQDGPGGAERAVDHADKPMLKDLAADKYGIAYAGVLFPQAGVKTLALAVEEGGPYVEISRATVLDRTWPLTRTVYMYINKPVGKPLDPKVREFMRYILSREGQQAVTQQKVYLPLTAGAVEEQRHKLD